MEFLKIEQQLRNAIRGEELSLYYQPIINLEDGELAGFEALVRWEHPEEGLLPPDSFIPIAEESDLIVELDRWVLTEACSNLSQWQKKFTHILGTSSSREALTVSVNVSARHLSDHRLLEDVQTALQESGLDPRSLIIEITESAIITNISQAKEILAQIKELGVKLHLDDFGEGYSSVNLLKSVPFDGMKIDKAYVTGFIRGEKEGKLLKSIIELGHAMDKKIVAEGIEEAEEALILKSYRCQHGQGYHFSRPVPAKEIDKLITRDDLGSEIITVAT